MIGAALLFALPILLFAACKSVEPRSEADVIPESLGTAEGLWLYRGNTRSLSDGTGEETLLTSVTVEETEYGEEDFEIITYKYLRDTYEIFYIISVDGQYRVYHYNYLTKASSDLCALTPAERAYNYQIEVSSSLVFIYNTGTDYGVILSRTAQLLCENFFRGTLDGNIVYYISGSNFTYFKDGALHEVPLAASYPSSSYHRNGNYVYLFGASACGINLETEKCFPISAINDIGSEVHYADLYCKGGDYYVMTINYIRRDDDDTEHSTRLFHVSGETSKLIYEFGNAPYGMRMGIDGDLIYLTQYGPRDWQAKYFVYNTNTEEIKRVSKKKGGKGKTPEELRKQEEAKKREDNSKSELSVGEYTFYVTSLGYDDEPGMFGRVYTKTCYYLMREYGGVSVVMQYSLNENRGHFYDDIREF